MATIAPPSKRTTPMQVLCLGMCRTGTQSLSEALTHLGITPTYHMKEVRKHNHESLWIRALDAKYGGIGDPIMREDFDDQGFLGGWAAVTDIPASLFPTELIAAYPEAKIILTTRDEEKWFQSMKATIWSLPLKEGSLNERIWKYVWGGDPEVFARERFRTHNEEVLRVAGEAGREVLIMQVGEGWERLCGFLGVEVPEGVDFPRADDWAAFGWKKTAAVGLEESVD